MTLIITHTQIFFPEMNKKKYVQGKKIIYEYGRNIFVAVVDKKKLIAHNRRKKTIIFKSLMDHSTTYSSIRINRASRFV